MGTAAKRVNFWGMAMIMIQTLGLKFCRLHCLNVCYWDFDVSRHRQRLGEVLKSALREDGGGVWEDFAN